MADNEIKAIHNSDSETEEEEFKGFENLSPTIEEVKTRPKNPIRLHLQKLSQQFRNLLRSPLSSSDDEFLECEGVRGDDEKRASPLSSCTTQLVEVVNVTRDDENNLDVSPRKQKKMDSDSNANSPEDAVEKIISKYQDLELTATNTSSSQLNEPESKMQRDVEGCKSDETNFS